MEPSGQRRLASWQSSGGARREGFLAQRLAPREALAAYTRDAAWALREEGSRGTLEVGKLADEVVLDQNPLRQGASIERIRRLGLFVGGYDHIGKGRVRV